MADIGFINGLVWPLIAAAVISVVALAIKSPAKYQKISTGLFFVGAAVMALTSVGFGAYERGVNDAFTHIEHGGTHATFGLSAYFNAFTPMMVYFVWVLLVFGLEWLGKYLADDAKP